MDTKEKIEVMKAYDEGKTIEFSPRKSVYSRPKWDFCPNPQWDWIGFEYRVKPEPREWYINMYADGRVHMYDNKSEADWWAGSNRKECVKVREVLD